MWKHLFKWILPSVCPGCRRDIAEGGPVCASCWASIAPPVPSPVPAGIERYRALAAFEGPLRDLVLSFKYRGRDYLGRSLGGWMAGKLPTWAVDSSAIVPVPAPAWRRIRRGYHPADVLARALGKEIGRPVISGALSRRHGYPSQTALDRQQRGENAAKSFKSGWRPGRLWGERVLLVDDVCTTGATLTACARLLRSAGARSVDAVVLAQEALRPSTISPKAPRVARLDGAVA